jgi:hypothetical protein
MTRLTKEQKDAIRKSKGSLSIAQMVDKFGVSKATIHRVLAGTGKENVSFAEDRQEVMVPTMETEEMTPAIEEYSAVLEGRDYQEPAPVKETREERMEPAEDKKAIDRLASNIFTEIEKEENKVVQKGSRVPQDIRTMVEDPVERTAVLQRIMLNLDNFGSVFTFIHDKGEFVKSLHKKSLDDLRGILKTMEQTRTTVNLANQMKQTFLMVGKATEVLGGRFLMLKTDGFVNNLLTQKQELDMIFRELAIDYAPKFTFQTRPEVRLCMLYGMCLLSTDNTNRIKEFVEEKSAQSVPEETAERFGDL